MDLGTQATAPETMEEQGPKRGLPVTIRKDERKPRETKQKFQLAKGRK